MFFIVSLFSLAELFFKKQADIYYISLFLFFADASLNVICAIIQKCWQTQLQLHLKGKYV